MVNAVGREFLNKELQSAQKGLVYDFLSLFLFSSPSHAIASFRRMQLQPKMFAVERGISSKNLLIKTMQLVFPAEQLLPGIWFR